MTFTVRADRRYIRSAHRSTRYLLVDIEAPAAERRVERDPVNLAFVLDRSGSMGGEKLRLAKQAIETVLGGLASKDRFAVIAYDDVVDVVVEATAATAEAKRNASAQLATISARGSTDLGAGWLRGSEQVALGLLEQGINRVLLLTDGLANRGITDREELAKHAGELRARGVSTTTFGVGEDFDEALLQAMASAGGGRFYFIEQAVQIRDHVASEVGELLEVVAHEAAIEVTGPDNLEVTTPSPYPVERRGNRHHVRLGNLVSEQQVQVVLAVGFGYGPIGEEVGILVGLTDRDGVLGAAGAGPVGVAWQYADDATNDEQPRDRPVDRAVARLYAARARQEAIGLNRHGDFEGAAARLRAVARRIGWYAGRDRELRAIIAELKGDEQYFTRVVPELSRKQHYAQASYMLRSMAPDGKASRRV